MSRAMPKGACLVKFGATHVLCTVSLEGKPPLWLRGQGRGWITAEYGMLPRATHTRTKGEVSSGRPSGPRRKFSARLAAVFAPSPIFHPWASGKSRSIATCYDDHARIRC
jgi:ribonuclease PH